MCNLLKDDYTTKLGKIKYIKDTIININFRLNALSKGPICVSNPELNEEDSCVKSGSVWRTNVYLPEEVISLNKKWYDHFLLFQKSYISGLNFIIYYIKLLLEKDITIEIINSIIDIIHNELVKLNDETLKSYLSLLKIKTYTKDDILKMKQEEQARLETLRHGNTFHSVEENKK